MICDPKAPLDAALSQIEESLLPGIATLLDRLLAAAALGRPGIDADAYASDLRDLAHQVDSLRDRYLQLAVSDPDADPYSITSLA
jgi:hypothetical protein